MISSLPLALQKPIAAYFESSLAKQQISRYHFPSESSTELVREIGRLFIDQESCILVRNRQEDLDLIGMIYIKDIPSLILMTIEKLDIVSLFPSNGGALAISADRSADDIKTDIHIISWGAMRGKVELIAHKLNGMTY